MHHRSTVCRARRVRGDGSSAPSASMAVLSNCCTSGLPLVIALSSGVKITPWAASDVFQVSVVLAASAGEDLNLAWMQGDFRLGQLFAGGNMSLNAVNGSLLSLLPGVALNAQNLHLQAQGSLGASVSTRDT